MADHLTSVKIEVGEPERGLATVEGAVPSFPVEIADKRYDFKLNMVVTAASLAAAAVASSLAPALDIRRASSIRIEAAAKKLALSDDEALIERRKTRNDVKKKSEVAVTPNNAERFGGVTAKLVRNSYIG